ncbi:MAG: DUF4126 domain-containing protein [Actinomycetes bacterium]
MATALSHIIPLAFASGLNLYATVAVLGLCSHYHLVTLPEQYRAFDHPLVIGAALTLYAIEFVADKIPWLDSLWDAVHTAVRPIGGAIIAVNTLGGASPALTAVAALVGGSVAATTHLAKAGTRAAVNTSPEPFSNWVLSLSEDALAIGISYGALRHPLAALMVALVLLAAIAACSVILFRALARRFRRRSEGRA